MKLSKKGRKRIKRMTAFEKAVIEYCAFILMDDGLITTARYRAIERLTKGTHAQFRKIHGRLWGREFREQFLVFEQGDI